MLVSEQIHQSADCGECGAFWSEVWPQSPWHFMRLFFSLASAFVPLTVALQWHTLRSGVAGIPLFLHILISCDSFAATQLYLLFPLLLHSSISQQVSLCLHWALTWLWQNPSFALTCCSLVCGSVLPLGGQLAPCVCSRNQNLRKNINFCFLWCKSQLSRSASWQ